MRPHSAAYACGLYRHAALGQNIAAVHECHGKGGCLTSTKQLSQDHVGGACTDVGRPFHRQPAVVHPYCNKSSMKKLELYRVEFLTSTTIHRAIMLVVHAVTIAATSMGKRQ